MATKKSTRGSASAQARAGKPTSGSRKGTSAAARGAGPRASASRSQASRSSSRGREAGESKTTTSHNVIRRWVEKRGAHPATVKTTARGEEAGVLRIDFPGYSGKETLEEISWDEFFEKFDDKKLAFLYQEQTASGRLSRFCKIVNREQGSARSKR